jgi:hypothetical protein
MIASRLFCLIVVSGLCLFQETNDDKKRPEFEKMWKAYPAEKHECKDLELDNQCAIRMSHALQGVGIQLDAKYKGNVCNCEKKYARGAQDLGAWLKVKWGTRDLGFEKPGKMPDSLKNKKGVILFMDIPGYNTDGAQGHIDLWDGTKGESGELKGAAYWNAATIWFWELK